jgi:signal transduction histidine kinase
VTPPSATPEAGGRETAPPDVLRGHWLSVARLAWVALAILSVVIFVASVPVGYTHILNHSNFVKEWGLSAGFYAAYIVVIGIAFALVSWTVAALLFWKCFAHRLALIVSIGLVAHGGTWWEGTFYLKEAYPRWTGVVDVVGILSSICLAIMYYMFPDGRFVPRWTRWAAGAYVAYSLLYYLSIYLLPSDSPFVAYNWPRFIFVSIVVAFYISFLLAQIYRFIRVSGPVARQQTKWILFAFTIDAVAKIASALSLFITERDAIGISDAELFFLEVIIWPLSDVIWLLIPLSIAVAILRYRLWDIDFIINRTLVYGTLTATVVGLYVLLVGGLGTLFQDQGDLTVSLVTTGLVAVLIAPLRNSLQRAVNRLMYGERDNPYAVLSRIGSRLEGALAPEEALSTVVEAVAQALKLPYAAIELRQDGKFVTAAEHGGPAEEDHLVLPLVYQSEEVGRLMVAPRAPGEAFAPADRRLLDDLAHQAGAVAHAARLTADLQRSRERLVTAREEERRRLRRDLHDGLGPTLGGLTLGLDAARNMIIGNPAAEELLVRLKDESREAVSEVRRLVYGLRPPALDDLGLVAAIRQQAAKHGRIADPSAEAGGQNDENGLVFSVEAPEDLPPLPAAVEVAAYRIIQEAMANVGRHAKASSCSVHLSANEATGVLELEVTDDGVGLPEGRRAGVGTSSMRERAEELGGTLRVEPLWEGGTRVLARLRLPAKDADEAEE